MDESGKVSTGISIRFFTENADNLIDADKKEILDNCLDIVILPDHLKLADMSPMFKSDVE